MNTKRTFWNFEPWLSRLFMFPPLVIFAVISFRYLTNPIHATAGVTLGTPEAFTDARLIGAWIMTLLLMLAISVLSQDRLWLGHVQVASFMGRTLVVRIFGLMNDGTTLAMGNQRLITIVDIVFLVLNSVGLVLQTVRRRKA